MVNKVLLREAQRRAKSRHSAGKNSFGLADLYLRAAYGYLSLDSTASLMKKAEYENSRWKG
ncbi:MAG: hypothetical protein [Bacteriophage sp.]|jgi:hypothetical protein|nr:MAG: hypothetical protein [Bacteriophage sp.]